MNRHTHRPRLHAARTLLVIAGSVGAADAHDAHATLGVSAYVVAVARLDMQRVPELVLVSRVDIERGYIDVAEPTAFTVRSNSPNGFVLDLLTVTPMVSSVVIQGLGPQLVVGADGGALVQRWQNSHVVNLSLRFRLVLAPGLAAGAYPWPLRIAVRPLETI